MLAFILSLIMCAVDDPALLRTWVDNTGQYRIEAELIEVKEGSVILKTGKGRVVAVPIKRLSDEDQAYAQNHRIATRNVETTDSSVSSPSTHSAIDEAEKNSIATSTVDPDVDAESENRSAKNNDDTGSPLPDDQSKASESNESKENEDGKKTSWWEKISGLVCTVITIWLILSFLGGLFSGGGGGGGGGGTPNIGARSETRRSDY